PTPFLFARPSVQVLRAKCAIILGFAQKMFELRSKNTASEHSEQGEEQRTSVRCVGMRKPQRCASSR
ncbi:hypothetical protein KKB10_05870, partial [Patescibacteria group bacterium]|nr:hypothetical protein [Patescibacteria group bacterium]